MTSTRRVAFQQVDVFTAVPFKGNPVAVVLEGDGLSTAQMQAIAGWTNLSETTFVCPPTDPAADYRLRIFTPRAEIPFAGHPTIGSAHALLRHGRVPRRPGRLVQECGKGLVDLRVDGDRLFLALPKPAFREPDVAQRAAAAAALGLTAAELLRAAIIDVGPVWFTVQLRDGATVTKLEPEMAAIAALSRDPVTGLNVFGLYGDSGPADLEVRSFAPAHGVPEDPSAVAATAAWRRSSSASRCWRARPTSPARAAACSATAASRSSSPPTAPSGSAATPSPASRAP
jgi:PhzF family phenazine biosynthesis protein